MKWFAFVRDGENDEDRARVRVVSLGTDGATVIDSIERGQGKLPISKCAGAGSGAGMAGASSMTDKDFCSDGLWVVPAAGPGSALADGKSALKGVPGGKIRLEYYAPEAGNSPTCTALVGVVKMEYTPKSGPIGTAVRLYFDPPGVVDWMSDSTTVLFTGKFVPSGDYAKTSETTISYPSDKVYFHPAKPDEVKVVIGEVWPSLAFLVGNPQVFLADFGRMVGVATVTTECGPLSILVEFDLIPTTALGTLVNGTFTPVTTFEPGQGLIAQILIKDDGLGTAPTTIMATVQSYDASGARIPTSPDTCAPPSIQVSMGRVTPTAVEGFLTYRSSTTEPIVTWPFPLTPLGTNDSYQYLYFIDGGKLTIEKNQ
jgi:hypothetical protein